MHVCIVNYAYDANAGHPWTLLDRYATLRGWSKAVLSAGADKLTVVQRFRHDHEITWGGVRYVFCADGGPATLPPGSIGRRVARTVAALRSDVIHINGLQFPAATGFLRVVAPECLLIVQDHAAGVPRSRVTRALWRRGLRSADAFMFAAAALACPWRTAGLLAPHQPVYEVMESSTDLAAPAGPAARGAVPGQPAILWVGRLNANKDPLTVLQGFADAARRLPAAELTLVYSEDDLLTDVQRFLHRKPELSSRVHLRGFVSHETLATMYAAADLFVLGSHHEGSGYALIEALSFGVVPVVTDIPTFRVLTRDGTLAALWQPGCPDSFAAALLEIWGRDLRTLRRGIEAHFSRELTWTAIGRAALGAYRDAAARESRTRGA